MILFEIALLPFSLLVIVACWHACFTREARDADALRSTGSARRARGAGWRQRAGAFVRRHLAIPGLMAVAWLWLNGTGLTIPLYEHFLGTTRWPTAPDRPFTTIVLLGGGTELTGPGKAPRPQGDSIEKVALAARLYHGMHREMGAPRAASPLAPPLRIVVSGGDPQRHGVAEADDYAPDLMALGVPADAIVHERRSLNTYQNAKFVRALLPAPHPAIVLVTTAQHMHRALLYFTRFGFDARPVTPPPQPWHYSWLPTVRNFARTGGDLHELIGTAQFHVYHALHLY